MRPSGTIADYLDALTRELKFDLELAGRVRAEVEDHLLEAVAHAPGQDRAEAACHAVASFGDPREIARQYAPSSLLQQARRVGGTLIVIIAAILVLMKGRGMVYDLLQWRLNADGLGIGTIGPAIDRYAFEAALIIGLLGWFYIASRRASPRLEKACRQQSKRCLLPPLVAASLLLVAVVLDVILGGLRLLDTRLSPVALIPLFSIAIEVALVAVVILELRRAIRRTSLVAALFTPEKHLGPLS
jgi:hypothetical protein